MVSPAQPEPWEAALSAFLRASQTWEQDTHRKQAQEFADKLDEV